MPKPPKPKGKGRKNKLPSSRGKTYHKVTQRDWDRAYIAKKKRKAKNK